MAIPLSSHIQSCHSVLPWCWLGQRSVPFIRVTLVFPKSIVLRRFSTAPWTAGDVDCWSPNIKMMSIGHVVMCSYVIHVYSGVSTDGRYGLFCRIQLFHCSFGLHHPQVFTLLSCSNFMPGQGRVGDNPWQSTGSTANDYINPNAHRGILFLRFC